VEASVEEAAMEKVQGAQVTSMRLLGRSIRSDEIVGSNPTQTDGIACSQPWDGIPVLVGCTVRICSGALMGGVTIHSAGVVAKWLRRSLLYIGVW